MGPRRPLAVVVALGVVALGVVAMVVMMAPMVMIMVVMVVVAIRRLTFDARLAAAAAANRAHQSTSNCLICNESPPVSRSR